MAVMLPRYSEGPVQCGTVMLPRYSEGSDLCIHVLKMPLVHIWCWLALTWWPQIPQCSVDSIVAILTDLESQQSVKQC